MTFLIFFFGYLFGWSCNEGLRWLSKRPYKIITKADYLSKYEEIQLFHLNKFKKEINEKLKQSLKQGHILPLKIDYYPPQFSEDSLNKIRHYIMFDLNFGDFELKQEDVNCRLILKE